MTMIPEEQGIDNAIEKRFKYFIKHFKINSLLRKINATKEKGVLTYAVFAFLLGLAFTKKNLYTLTTTTPENMPFGKDVVYRFLSNQKIHWERLIPNLSREAIAEVDELTSEERKSAYILDDTPYYRNRSKKVEMLSKCYDHAENRYYKGFELLNLGWSDGQTVIPVDFRLSASGKDKNLLYNSQVKEDKRTLCTKRRTDARKDKPTLSIEMLKSVKDTGAQAKYVLFDSWFSSPSFILSVNRLGFFVTARLKNHENYRYLYDGQHLSLDQIYKTNKKRRGKSRYLLSVEVQIRHDDFPETIPAKIVFVRNKNNRKNWIALISTDMCLNEEEIIALYGKRWDIEPFHKVIKSSLNLTKEFQLRSFDAITAHTAIVLTRYVFLSLENRQSKDERTIGALFMVVCDELSDISFSQALELILSTIKFCLCDYLHLEKFQLNEFVEQFVVHLPVYIKDKLGFSMCES